MGLFAGTPGPSREPESGTPGRRSDIEAILQDLSSAAEYQREVLPGKAPLVPGYEFGLTFLPARGVSGDFYDFIALPGGRLGIAVADASGKGMPAALATMTCRSMLRAQPEPEPEAAPARVLANVNRMLRGNVKPGMFVSAVYAVLDPAAHTLTVANAGHLPVVVWRSRQKVATVHRSRGPVIGVLPPEAYEAAVGEEEIHLGPGDRFVLITDGVNEAMAPGQKEFGMEHLAGVCRRRATGPAPSSSGPSLSRSTSTAAAASRPTTSRS